MRPLIAEPEREPTPATSGDLGLAADADEVQLVGLEEIVRRAVEADAVRRFEPPVDPPHGAAQIGVVADGPAEPAGEGLVPVLVVRQVVVGAQVRELAEVVEAAARCRRAPPTRGWCRNCRRRATAIASGTRVRPRRDVMLITPASASVPEMTLLASRSTSMRSTPAIENCARSMPPPMSLAGIPSMSTLLKLELPPRMNIEVTPPFAPVCDQRRRRARAAALRARRSCRAISSVFESSTVTGAPICEGSTSVAADVTDTLSSSGPIGSATSTDTRAPPATNIGSVVRVRESRGAHLDLIASRRQRVEREVALRVGRGVLHRPVRRAAA